MEQTFTSPAAQVIISLIPIVGIVIGGVIIFFTLLWHHHETKQRIKAGRENPQQSFNYRALTLLSALLLTGIGFMLSLFFILINGISPALLGGLIPLTIGICLLIFYKLYDWHNDFRSASN